MDEHEAPRDDSDERKPTSPEERGPLEEEINAAAKFPSREPSMPRGSEVTEGWRRRDPLWPEVHDPTDTDRAEVDPRASGDATPGYPRADRDDDSA